MHQHSILIGGTHGTGRYMARMLAERGQTVTAIGRRSITGEELGHPDIHTCSLDITDTEQVREVFPQLCQERGMWTSLLFFQKFRGASESDSWLGEWQVSLNATKQIVDLAVDLCRNEPLVPRSIVVVGSVGGKMVLPGQPIGYHAAKAALENMVRYWAVHLGKLGIRVNMVSPHAVLKEESADFYLSYTKLMDLYKQIIPLGRMGTSHEVASVADFLCSEAASYVTGQNLVVDGGITLPVLEGPVRAVLNMER